MPESNHPPTISTISSNVESWNHLFPRNSTTRRNRCVSAERQNLIPKWIYWASINVRNYAGSCSTGQLEPSTQHFGAGLLQDNCCDQDLSPAKRTQCLVTH